MLARKTPGEMIFTGRSVDALDDVRAAGGATEIQTAGRRDMSAVAIASGWFSSLRRPGKKKKSYQKQQAKSAWDLSGLTTVSRPAQDRSRSCARCSGPSKRASRGGRAPGI